MTRRERIAAIKKGKPFRIADGVVIALCVIISVSLILASCLKKDDTKVRLSITCLGLTIYESLDKDREIRLDELFAEKAKLPEYAQLSEVFSDGTHYVLKIEDGTARVIETHCKSKVCADMGRISKTNESIICTYYKIVIRVVGNDDGIHGTVGGA